MDTTPAKREFQVGPRKQGIPEFAEKWGNRWFHLRMFSVQRYKGQPHIVTVYRVIVYQLFDNRTYEWIDRYGVSFDSETWNNGQWRSGDSNRTLEFDDFAEAMKYVERRVKHISSIWPIIDDETAINRIGVTPLLVG